MTDLDVSLRLRLQRSGFAEGERDLKDVRRAAAALGGTGAGKALGGDLQSVEQRARGVRQALDQLGASEARLGNVGTLARMSGQLDRLRSDASSVVSEMRELRDALRNLQTARGVDRLASDLDAAGREADDLTRKLKAVEDASDRVNGRSTHRGFGAGNRADFGNELADRTGLNMILPGRMSAAGAGGLAAGATAYGLGYAGYKATSEAMSLETAMAAVKRQVSGVNDAQLSDLEGGILRLSETTGIAKENLAALVANAAKTKTAFADLLPFAERASKFSVAAEMGQDEAGQVISLLREQYALKPDRVPGVLDSVNYLADRSAAGERDILAFMGRTAENGKIAGLSPEEVAAFGTGFLNIGVQPDVAATGFKALTNNLGTAASTAAKNQDFRKSLGTLGLSGRELQDDFYKDGAGTIVDLLERIGKQPRERQLEILKGLGGQEYGDDFAALTGQTKALKGFLTDSQSPAAKGSVDATFSVYNDTTARNLAKAGASLASLGAEIGKPFLTAVNKFADAVSWFAGGAAENIRRERAAATLAEKQLSHVPLTAEEKARLAADPRLGAIVGSTVFERENSRRIGRRADEDRGVDQMGDPEEQALARARLNAERRREDLRTALSEEELALGILPKGEAGHEEAKRNIEAMRRSLAEIEATLKQMGGEAAGPQKMSFSGGFGEPRLIPAAFRGDGGFRGAYSGAAPVMDGFAGASGRSPGYGGGRLPPGAAPFLTGGPSGSVTATANPGGAAGELFDVFQATGFSDAQSLALLGHAKKESSLNPKAFNDREGAGGILQWRGNRLANLKSFAASKGMDWQDRSVQGAFVRHEMDTDPYERKRSERFRSATTIEEASAGLEDYVRFGDGSGAERLGNARNFAGQFGVTGGVPPSIAAGAKVGYTNAGATRNRPVTPELLSEIQRGVSAVYGEGYRAEIYSGGQGAKGSGLARVGSTRHDDHGRGGRAADLYVVGPDGKRVTGEELAKLGQHWAATGQGGVGMEMRGGGIHLDQHKDRAKHWNYARQGGRYTKGQRAIMEQGLAGIPPHYTNPGVLDPAKLQDFQDALNGPAGSREPLPAPRRMPSWDDLNRPEGRAGGAPGRATAGAGRSTPPLVIHQNFAGTDPGLQARRAQREQGRAIKMAEARAMHDTAVPIA